MKYFKEKNSESKDMTFGLKGLTEGRAEWIAGEYGQSARLAKLDNPRAKRASQGFRGT